MNILFCTGEFEVFCAKSDSFEEVKENWEERFEEEPKMNGCVNNIYGETVCFCDSDGCNSETKLSRDLTNIFEKSDDNELDLNTMGSHTTLKCWQCSTKATTFGFKFGKCPNDFGDETLLTDCKSNAFCLKTEYKGKKLIFLSVSLC